jgi:hypothetical protein
MKVYDALMRDGKKKRGEGKLLNAEPELTPCPQTHAGDGAYYRQLYEEAEAENARLRARVLELQAQCEAGFSSEMRWLEWLTEQGLLHYHGHCTRPDGSSGPAWVLRTPATVNGDSCEAWHADSAAGALRKFLRA